MLKTLKQKHQCSSFINRVRVRTVYLTIKKYKYQTVNNIVMVYQLFDKSYDIFIQSGD